MTESVLLCVLAGGLSFIVARWMLDLAVAFRPPTLIGQAESPTLPLGLRLDARLFVVTFGLSMLSALLVGLVSAFQVSRPGATGAMQQGRTTDRSFAPGFNVRSSVIGLQMALSMLLLIPCGLFVRSWLNGAAIDPGFVAERVLLLPVSTEQAGFRVQKPHGFDQQIVDAVAALPGVEAATLMDPVPLWFGGNAAIFEIEGGQAPGAPHRMGFSRVAPRYFETLRIPLLRGRDFMRSDDASAPQVAIVNETTARRFWPDGNALGQRIRSDDVAIEIVGIAADAKYASLAETSQPWLYLPLAQNPTDNTALSLALRTTGDPLQLRAGVEREVRALVPGWPTFQFRTLDEGLKLQRRLPRLGATLLGILGGFGLLLAAIGVYGVMAYVVKQRTQEIGIRLALGAPIVSVLGLVMRQGMAVCTIGAAVGMGIMLATSRLLGSLLYGISGFDPLTYVAVPTLLLAVALLACYLPARRVTRLNAAEALHTE